jgi:TonB family protein
MKINLTTLLLLLLAFSGFSQEVGYTVFGTQTNPYSVPGYSLITLDSLQDAKTLTDIHARYRSSWVASYIAVEVASTCQGVVKKAAGKNDTLTPAQLDILKMADADCSIQVEVDYIPQNNLTYNPPRKMDFSLKMVPVFEAKFPGGDQALKKFIKENTIDKISKAKVGQIELAQISFTINEDGQVTNARLFKSSEEDMIDQLLLEAICNMPTWLPAKNSKGLKITQEFEFSIGTSLLLCPSPY